MSVVVTHSTPSDSTFSTQGAAAWDATHSIAGIGTLAEQNANNVAITGGSINGATVGASVTASGAFTTLSASGTVSGTGFSTYLASPPAIGGTTPAAGSFTTLIGGSGSANYGQLTGGATTKAVQFQTLGTDANISVAVQPKGTGAIDFAAGSSGVNVSNGGTVTAITRTASGSGYTSLPSMTISAPTTAGGVQATATANATVFSLTSIANGGTGYSVNDVLTVSGTYSSSATITVTGVSAGVITTATVTTFGTYSVIPSNPVAVTGGTGTGATFNLNWGVSSTFTITNAGSGYVEQPTVSFSGGGGSGAAAYATVGGTSIVRSLGTNIDFYTPGGVAFRVADGGASSTTYWESIGSATTPSFLAVSSTSGAIGTVSAVPIVFRTSTSTEQLRVSHTASAVNYVQVTGGATGSPADVTISAQGSSADVNLAFTPRGTNGRVKFGTHTGVADTAISGYIEIRDSGGTLRKLAVIT